MIISPFTHFLYRHQIARDDGLFHCCVYPNVHFGINNSVLSIYHQNNFEDLFHHSEDKGLLPRVLPTNCHLYLLWKLHFHVHESISKGQGVFEQGSGCAKHLSNPHAEPFYLYCAKHLSNPHAEPFYLYLKEYESQVSLHGHGQEDYTLLKETKK